MHGFIASGAGEQRASLGADGELRNPGTFGRGLAGGELLVRAACALAVSFVEVPHAGGISDASSVCRVGFGTRVGAVGADRHATSGGSTL